MKIAIVILLGILYPHISISQEFARGADIGWLSEMEASGKKFYNDQGNNQDVLEILQDHCINSIRFRVWVNPTGGWSGTDDVVQMSKRAANMGFRIMIDFHYSDNWADPGKQYKPASWQHFTVQELTQAVYDHTYNVLNAIKNQGVSPEWVQIGNETNDGMLWEEGKASEHMNNYAAFVKSGNDAAKAVFPNIITIVHVSNGWDSSLFDWNIGGLIKNGAKFDAIGMSLYPEPNNWQTTTSQCLSNMQALIEKYNKPIIISEIGMSWSYASEAKAFVEDIITKNMNLPNNKGLGVFWWEPQCYNWRGYDKGTWGLDGKPTIALDGFMRNCNTTQTDCNGDENGTAYIDACGNCVGGNTTREECSSVKVTFKVNLAKSGITSIPYITGDMTLNGTNWTIEQMEHEWENTYTKTYLMMPGSTGGYYYLSDNNWNSRETVPTQCIGMYEKDRGYKIGKNDTTIAVDWAGCTFTQNTQHTDCFGTTNGSAYTDSCGRCVEGETTAEACFTQNITFRKGWNLITIGTGGDPLPIENIHTKTNIQTIKTFDTFWEKGSPNHFNGITQIEQGKGYFIFTNNESTKISIKVIPNNTIDATELIKGWNLVGIPVKKSFSITNLPKEISTVKDFENFNDLTTNTGFLTELQEGKAYLMHAKANCTIIWTIKD